ncbi:MAG: hypothetical protein AAFS07_01890 [Pseudomonadota bacterium]
MRETHFAWPGRYAMWREDGVLWFAIEGSRRVATPIPPRQGYRFLMDRRRTELLYAIASAVQAEDTLSASGLRALATTLSEGSEEAVAREANRWNGCGRVMAALTEIIGAEIPQTPEPRWFAAVPRRERRCLDRGP